MSQEERTLLTQELAALTQILCFQYEHPGYLMFGQSSKIIYEMEQRQTGLAKVLYG